MPRILVQTDDGDTVQTIEFPIESTYALSYMPSCPTNMGVHKMLMRLKRALQDAEALQRKEDRRKANEIVVDRSDPPTDV